jgi:NAD(P)-dependent dehydrogenase (short-subunit alcohol dehydrogenase family)
MTEFKGRHILVTGASTGIGRATARMLARRGARVSLIARSEATLQEAVAEIRSEGGAAAYGVADVGDKFALLSVFDTAEGAFGPIEGLFANAGMGGSFAPFSDYDDDMFDTVIRTNMTSVFWAMKRVLPGMVARRRGSIVITGSLASERGMANNPGYVASKHAALGLARAAALEVAPSNVRVNCILPGLIETPLLHNIGGDDIPAAMAFMGRNVPQGRVGTADETAEVATFLLSDAASHVTGQGWAVDGGILGTLSVR